MRTTRRSTPTPRRRGRYIGSATRGPAGPPGATPPRPASRRPRTRPNHPSLEPVGGAAPLQQQRGEPTVPVGDPAVLQPLRRRRLPLLLRPDTVCHRPPLSPLAHAAGHLSMMPQNRTHVRPPPAMSRKKKRMHLATTRAGSRVQAGADVFTDSVRTVGGLADDDARSQP